MPSLHKNNTLWKTLAIFIALAGFGQPLPAQDEVTVITAKSNASEDGVTIVTAKSPPSLVASLTATEAQLLSTNTVADTSDTTNQAVTSFTLINADTNDPIPGYENLTDGTVIDAGSMNTSRLNIRANTNAEATIGSVSFSLDNIQHVENFSPFALFGNTGDNYYAGQLTPGSHVLTATPFTKNHGTGSPGTSLTISFTVSQTGPTPTPTPTPTATPTPSATPTPTPSATPTPTPSATPVPTPTPTASPTATPITSVTLAWNASTSPDIAGYHVSYGSSSGSYTQRTDVGNKTSATISGLTSGRTYYFAVSAYNTSAAESALSNEVSFNTGSTSSATSSSGTTTGAASSSAGSTTTPNASSAGSQPTAASTAYLASVSSRVHVGTNSEIGMAGFLIGGAERKTLVVRALGPSLTRNGVRGVLANPMLEIHDARGNVIGSNDGWRISQGSAFAEGGRYHAFQPGSELEPAIVMTLPAGTYTAVVRGKNNAQGIALVEIFDVSQGNGSKLGHVSARALVGPGENALFGRIVVGGSGNVQVVMRVLGPSLTRYGITNPLANPRMSLYNSNGVLLHSADNWTENPAQANLLKTSGYAPSDPREPALIMLLQPGAYTAVVSGENNTTGVAMLDTYILN